MRVVDVLLVIPTLPLIILLNNRFSHLGYALMITIFVIFGWCGTARIIRAQVLSLRNSNHIKAAELFGANKWYTMIKHILPAVSHLLIMNAALASAGFMVAEAGISFLFNSASSASWGQVIVAADNYAMASRLWAWVLAPGVAIFITVMGFMRIGSAMEEIFNPRLANMRSIAGLNKTEAEISEAFATMTELSDVEAERIFKTIPTEKTTGGAKV